MKQRNTPRHWPDLSSTELNEDEKASIRLVLSIGRAFKSVDEYVRPRMRRLGLTMTEFSVLSVLYHNGETPLGELSQRILLTGASTTYTVKKLEQRGLLVRTPLLEDHRVIMGSVTTTGRKLLEHIFPLHARHLAEVMHKLSIEEKNSVTKSLQRLAGSFPLNPKTERHPPST
jgi:MarR family 2-MHQ and catechol resistance regulon transcriptional repressor